MCKEVFAYLLQLVIIYDELRGNTRWGRKGGFLYDLRIKSPYWVKEGKRVCCPEDHTRRVFLRI
jgi:hypothetical protein